MASLAEYERELIRERTNAGLQAARTRGKLGGRPKGYTKEIYEPLGLTRAAFYRYARILDHHTDAEIKKMSIKK